MERLKDFEAPVETQKARKSPKTLKIDEQVQNIKEKSKKKI
jgi:hypothetical protein